MTSILPIVLDPHRLVVTGSLLTPRTSEDVAARTGLDRGDVLAAIGALRMAGLVEACDRHYVLVDGALRRMASAAPPDPEAPMDPRVGYGMTDEERVVLARFFSGTTLVEIPTAHRKRLIVLERLGLEFEPGRRYDEFEVNETLGAFHPDVAALRRALVDEGILDRAAGEYWRSGGRVDSIVRS